MYTLYMKMWKKPLRPRRSGHTKSRGVRAAASSSVEAVRSLFAGQLDYTNVTEFRESLLPMVNELTLHQTKKYLVTRHGKPLAVFLSFPAFESLRRVVETLLDEEAAKDVGRILVEARDRMDRDHLGGAEGRRQLPSVPGALPKDLSAQVQVLRDGVARLESMLTELAEESRESAQGVESS
jgi:PHD/YefM family antitoxin component YafN of YafNO toxin-antitoxin module